MSRVEVNEAKWRWMKLVEVGARFSNPQIQYQNMDKGYEEIL